jgi:hypothetical protein
MVWRKYWRLNCEPNQRAGANFINIFCALFSSIFWRQKLQSCAKRFRMKFCNKNALSYKKCVRKMLKKLTTACVSLIYEVNSQRYINKNRVRYRYLDIEVSLQQHFVKIFMPPIIKNEHTSVTQFLRWCLKSYSKWTYFIKVFLWKKRG